VGKGRKHGRSAYQVTRDHQMREKSGGGEKEKEVSGFTNFRKGGETRRLLMGGAVQEGSSVGGGKEAEKSSISTHGRGRVRSCTEAVGGGERSRGGCLS